MNGGAQMHVDRLADLLDRTQGDGFRRISPPISGAPLGPNVTGTDKVNQFQV